MLLRSLLSLTVLGTLSLAGLMAAVGVGDAAPALSDAGLKYVKQGDAVLPLDNGEKYTVVEFWATWCPPCRDSIPHLTKLQERYADSVQIVGISVDQDESLVAPFVTEWGDKMDYIVAYAGDSMESTYMADVEGIPHAFLVDPQGQVVWRGMPMAIDSMLDMAAQGTLTADKAKAISAANDALMNAARSGKPGPIGEAAAALLEVDPGNSQGLDLALRVAEYQDDAAAHKAIAEKLTTAKLSPYSAASAAERLLQESIELRHLAAAKTLVEQAQEQAPNAEPVKLATAKLRYALGDVAGALSALDGLDTSEATTLRTYYETAKSLQ